MSNFALARRATVVAGAVLVGILSACGSQDDPSGAGAGHNDADVSFATQMIPHHAQAVEMAELVEGKDVEPEVADLAAAIRAAQDTEIETMTGWLESWDQPVPDENSMEGHSMEGMDEEMTGMMSEEEMTGLDDAEGAVFQSLWLEMMLEHHEGAVEMAQAEQEDGEYRPALDLAAVIEEAQAREIEVMQELLRG